MFRTAMSSSVYRLILALTTWRYNVCAGRKERYSEMRSSEIQLPTPALKATLTLIEYIGVYINWLIGLIGK